MKIKVYIHAEYNEWEKKYAFSAWSIDMSDHRGPVVGVQEIDFDPPPHEVLVNGTVAKYREMQKEILAEAEAKRLHLERKINELLCIEHKPELGNEVATGTTE